MSPKNCSLAYDEAVREFDLENGFEPHLKVLINTQYAQASLMNSTSDHDVVSVRGSITISF